MPQGTYTTPPSDIAMIIAARGFQTKSIVWLKEDIFMTRPGVGRTVYAKKGEQVIVMSYDPWQDNAYGVRSLRKNPDGSSVESYCNAPASESQLSNFLIQADDAQPVGL